MKAYILIKESIPLGFAMVSAAHAGAALGQANDPDSKEWRAGIWRKCVCKVSDAEFEAAKIHPNRMVLTESALDNQEVALVFYPRQEWPKGFGFYRLYK